MPTSSARVLNCPDVRRQEFPHHFGAISAAMVVTTSGRKGCARTTPLICLSWADFFLGFSLTSHSSVAGHVVYSRYSAKVTCSRHFCECLASESLESLKANDDNLGDTLAAKAFAKNLCKNFQVG